MKILVIGAGPVGLTVALEFAHHAIKPELVEKRSGPSEFSRAVGILPVTRYHLRHEGVDDSILRESVPWRKFQFRGSPACQPRSLFRESGADSQRIGC